MRAFILRKLSRVMAEYDDLERLIPLIQEHWLQVTVREEVLRLLPPAAGIIHRDQGVITNFMQSFKWVDDFLEVN